MKLILLASALAIASAQQTYYWKRPNQDAPGTDIQHIAGATLQQLEDACTALPSCVAFNTDGWLKNATNTMTNGQPCDLYLKQYSPEPGSGLSLWPIPTDITTGATTLTVAPAFNFVATTPSNDLSAAFTRISALIFQHNQPASVMAAAARARVAATGGQAVFERKLQAGPTLTQLTVTVNNISAPLQLGVDESYTLNVPADGTAATLTANTVYGAYHGLQTFSQMVTWSPDSKSYLLNSAPVMINDQPRFAWRGILIDTDRHFLPLGTIYTIIDSITYAKMNTLHWHIVDWQSWPMESAAYPALWNASWSYTERYTFEDLAAVVEYARQRGVRVVPEFDTPGHAGSICTGYPDACPSPTCTMPVNPASNTTLPLINAVLAEISALTPDTYFHLGGDEVDTSCWTNTPAVAQWMTAHGYTADQTYEYFVQAVDTMTLNLGKIPIRWEEVWKHFGTDLDPRTVIHVWLSTETMVDVTNHGYNGIYSVDGQYYLDALGEDWSSFYDIDPLSDITNVTAKQFVLGGETEMWGETADPSDVLQTIWPRAAAAAERQWSYNVVTNSSAPGVVQRLSDFRCLLTRRGIAAAPVYNPTARSAPPGPGSCILQ